MLRHFNQDHVGRWTMATGLAISHVTGSRGAGRKSDPFDVQITQHALRKQQRPKLNRSAMSFFVRFSFGALIAAACVFASLPAFSQSSDTKSGDKPAAAQPADPAKDAQRQVDEFAEATRLVN